MTRRLVAALAVLRATDFRTYYCASCGGHYPIKHFHP